MKSAKEIINTSNYKQKLQSDEWRKFRKNMRQTKGDCCACCKSGTGRLELHHLFYESSREPWEYEAHELVLLCEHCHRSMHVELQNFRKFVFGYLTPRALQVINGALRVGLEIHKPIIFAHAIAEFVSDSRAVERFAKSFVHDLSKNS